MTSSLKHQPMKELTCNLGLLLLAIGSTVVASERLGSQLSRRAANDAAAPIVVGKFRAPAPERIQRQRIPQEAEFGARTLSASFRVSDAESSVPEKTVHGIGGLHQSTANPVAAKKLSNSAGNKRLVSAKIQVSDEGLNYPPSKLSADIYGNVAEIVTAPPEAVDQDFLLPVSSRYSNRSVRRQS